MVITPKKHGWMEESRVKIDPKVELEFWSAVIIDQEGFSSLSGK